MDFLNKEEVGLWIVDVQEKLFPQIDHSYEVLEKICFTLDAAKHLHLPVFVTEQYPQGLGPTLSAIKKRLPENQVYYSKTSFSGYYETLLKTAVDELPVKSWILVGFEAHICILQTAKDLLNAGKKVVVLNDAVSSRSVFDFSTAMGELRELGVRLSSAETVIFEIVRDAASAEFGGILDLVKTHAHA